MPSGPATKPQNPIAVELAEGFGAAGFTGQALHQVDPTFARQDQTDKPVQDPVTEGPGLVQGVRDSGHAMTKDGEKLLLQIDRGGDGIGDLPGIIEGPCRAPSSPPDTPIPK